MRRTRLAALSGFEETRAGGHVSLCFAYTLSLLLDPLYEPTGEGSVVFVVFGVGKLSKYDGPI
jgi:hypothetical protein